MSNPYNYSYYALNPTKFSHEPRQIINSFKVIFKIHILKKKTEPTYIYPFQMEAVINVKHIDIYGIIRAVFSKLIGVFFLIKIRLS